jgi:DNA polymerase-3 subunit epsilon
VILPWDLIVFDLETAGDPHHRVVEIGAVRVSPDLQIRDTFSSLVDGRPMSPEVIDVHHITEPMLQGQPKFAEMHTLFDEFCQKSNVYILGAYGAYFDIPVLRAEYRRIGVKFPHPGHAIDLKGIIWFELLKRGFPSKRLDVDRAVELLGMKFEGQRHRALPDAMMEAKALVTALKGKA